MILVKTRKNTFARLGEKTLKTALKKFGRDDIILTRKVRKLDSLGAVIKVETIISTIQGDLQFVTYNDHQLLNQGVANLGDGMFYTISNIKLKPDNTILVDGVTWRFSKLVEFESIGISRYYQAWVCVRIDGPEGDS